MLKAMCAAAVAMMSGVAAATPFMFQGEIRDGGAPVNGVYDLRFSMWGVSSGGAQIGSELCFDNVSVNNGRFAVSLDFGAVFTGADRFLEISVRPDSGLNCGNIAGFATLGPRVQVTDAPMATFAAQAGTATSAANTTNLNGQPASYYQNAVNLTGSLSDARLSGNIPRLNNATSTFTGVVTATSFTGSGSGITNLSASNLTGQVADARLSSNIPKLNVANTFSGGLTAPSFSGSGSLLTGLNASSMTTGTVADNLLSSNIPLKAAANTFSAINTFSNRVGIGSTPSAMLHVSGGSSGATASTSSEVVIEDNSSSYLQFLTPDVSERGIAFGSTTNGFEGGIYYTDAGGMSLRTGGNNTRVSIAPTGAVTFQSSLGATFSGPITIPTTTRHAMLSSLSFTNTGGMLRLAEYLVSSGNASSQLAYAPVLLPEGATITSIALIGSDTSGNNMTLQLVTRGVDPLDASSSVMATVNSSGSAGTITKWQTSSITGPVIDNASNIYFVTVSIPGGTATQDLTVLGVRFTYTVNQPLP